MAGLNLPNKRLLGLQQASQSFSGVPNVCCQLRSGLNQRPCTAHGRAELGLRFLQRPQKPVLPRQQIPTEGILDIASKTPENEDLLADRHGLVVLLLNDQEVINQTDMNGEGSHQGHEHPQQNGPDLLLPSAIIPPSSRTAAHLP